MEVVTKALDELKRINNLTNEVFSEEIGYIDEMYNDNIFKVVVIGEFSSGKSTFLNALIGKRILYSHMDEATGMTTAIENSKENVAIINFEDGDMKKIPIGTENDYKELSNYLNINKQEDKKVRSVDVKYSFDGIDKDIIFVDTPGLQGMSDEQLMITKKAIKDANATIMLINKKGLSQTELDLICGRNEDFGRIKTKEIFVLINKIGEVYDFNGVDEANEKIERIISQVKMDLSNNGVNDSKVFAIDGLDYLHGKDNALYEKFRLSKANTSYKVLSQEEYILRSRYEDFKSELFEFLNEDNRKKAFEEDIKEKIGIVLDEIEELVEANLGKDKVTSKAILDKYDKEINMLIENRRRFINILKRQVGELSEELQEKIYIEIKEFKESLVGSGGKILLDIDKKIDKKSIDNLEGKVDGLLFDAKKLIKDEGYSIEKNIEVFYKNLGTVISETFTEEFKKVFKSDCDINFEFVGQDIFLDLKFNEDKFSNEYNEEIKRLKKDLEKKKEMYSIEEIGKIKQYIKRYDSDIKDIEDDLKAIEREYKIEKNSLGDRPCPKQKYRTVERTKRKWLIFKETYYEDIPDGVDDSQGQAWDNRNREIDNSFSIKQDRLYTKRQGVVDKKNAYNRELTKKYILEDMVKKDEETIKKLEDSAKKSMEKSKEIYIENKKEEIYVWISKHIDDNIRNLYNAVEFALGDKNEVIKKSIEIQGNEYLKDYKEKLELKRESIRESIKNKKVSDEHLFELINNLRDTLVEGA